MIKQKVIKYMHLKKQEKTRPLNQLKLSILKIWISPPLPRGGSHFYLLINHLGFLV